MNAKSKCRLEAGNGLLLLTDLFLHVSCQKFSLRNENAEFCVCCLQAFTEIVRCGVHTLGKHLLCRRVPLDIGSRCCHITVQTQACSAHCDYHGAVIPNKLHGGSQIHIHRAKYKTNSSSTRPSALCERNFEDLQTASGWWCCGFAVFTNTNKRHHIKASHLQTVQTRSRQLLSIRLTFKCYSCDVPKKRTQYKYECVSGEHFIRSLKSQTLGCKASCIEACHCTHIRNLPSSLTLSTEHHIQMTSGSNQIRK